MNGKFLNDKRLPGYRIKASEWNELNRRVGAMSMLPAVGSFRASLTNGLGMLTHNPIPLHLLLVELDEDLGPEATPAVPVSGPSGSASRAAAAAELPEDDFRDQPATVLYFDPDDGDWKRNEEFQVQVVTDPYKGLVWDKGARLLVMPYDQAGRYIPVPQVTIRQVRTKADSPSNYPAAATNPNTYPIEFINNSYPATVGKQVLSTAVKASSLDTAPGDAVPHNVVFNLNEAQYIPEDTIIPAWFLFGQWWTYVGLPEFGQLADPCVGLVAFYHFDEPGTAGSDPAPDAGPNKFDLIEIGTTIIQVTGKFNGAREATT